MPKLFPGLLLAVLAVIPGWMLGAFAASPKLLDRPLADNFAMFARGTPVFLLLFGVITLVYGSMAWIALRSLGALHLASLLVASALPVIAYVLLSVWTRGHDPGWPGAVLAFGIPSLSIGAAVWLFTVRMPL
jgi:ABC-type amino acid transport system permease subunit